MLRYCFFFFFIIYFIPAQSQPISEKTTETKQDSTKKKAFLKQLGKGYINTKYLNLYLRYLAKYNKYEGVRTSIGGVTTENFSKKFHIKNYVAYGFNDNVFKHSTSLSFRLNKKTNTWVNLSYTDDLEESATTTFLTDNRYFKFSQPRLLNIDLFHEHITKQITLEYNPTPKLLSETEIGVSTIKPTYNYGYIIDDNVLNSFKISTAKIAFEWSPFSVFKNAENKTLKEVKNSYPKFTFQYTKSFKNVFNSHLNFNKINFRAIHKIEHLNKGLSEILFVSGITNGNVPLTHLYHSYPNNLRIDKVFKRFSVAGLHSFETMFFNEFFSDRFAMIQFKHHLKPFNISDRFKPQLAFISKYAIGDIKNIERHQNINFNSLRKGYNESGVELNKLFFGFGLSLSYRHGAYHLPRLDDNIAFKFTFNVTL